MLKSIAEGYKPQVDWGGHTGDAALTLGGQQVTVSAWRKKLLLFLLGGLLVLAVANFMTTLWVLSRVNFNMEGLGSLHVEVGGLHLKGASWLAETSNTARIQSRPGKTLKVFGYHNTSIIAMDDQYKPLTAMVLDTLDATLYSSSLSVTGEDGQEVFYTDQQQTRVGADIFKVTGDEGAQFDRSAQTSQLLSHHGHQLGIESSTRAVKMAAREQLSVEARDGDVNAACHDSITFASDQGVLRFLTASLYAPGLPIHGGEDPSFSLPSFNEAEGRSTTPTPETQIPSPDPAPPTTPTPAHQDPLVMVYQVCVCPSGRLFLADAKSVCVPDVDTCK